MVMALNCFVTRGSGCRHRQSNPMSCGDLGAYRSSDAVFQFHFASRSRAVDTAENLPVGFNAVSDDSAVAMRANRRQRVDCALKAIEGVMLPANDDFKRLVIFIFANFACSHT